MVETKQKRKRLPRVGAPQLDRARSMLKQAAENETDIDYDQIAEDYVKAENVELDGDTDAKKYFFKSVLAKSPGGIYFPRTKSDKMDEEMLIALQEAFGQGTDMSELIDASGIEDLTWDDLYVGYDKAQRTRRKRNKHKPIAEALGAQENISNTIMEMYESHKRIPEITEYINEVIDDGVPGIAEATVVDKAFTQYFLHTFKDIPRKKRLTEEQKEERDETIKAMLKEGKTYDEIAEAINATYGSRQKADSLRAMVYSRKLTDGTGKRGRARKYTVESLSDEVCDFISLKYGREGVSVDKVRDGLKSQMDFDIPKHGLIRIIKDLNLEKGKIEPTPEQKAWLRDHAPSCLSQQELTEDFNKEFETSYEEDTIRKFDTVAV